MALSDINKIEKEFDIITFAIIIIFQMFLAMATISFITHGMTYIDDNISPKHSPGFIGWLCQKITNWFDLSVVFFLGLAFGANEIGKQVGLYCSWSPYVIDIDSIFISPGKKNMIPMIREFQIRVFVYFSFQCGLFSQF